MSKVEEFEKLKEKQTVSTEDLDTLFEVLEPVTLSEIMGEWKGGGFNTGHAVLGALQSIKWYGKTFISPLDVKSLICYDENGNLHSDTKSMNGEATVWPIEYRGKVSMSLVYDGVPIIAHFRKVQSNILIGIRDGKDALDNGKLLYFYLERI